MTLKLQATFLLPDEIYLIKLDSHFNHKFIVNGLEISKTIREIVVKSLDEIKVEVTQPRKLIHYKNKHDQILSIEEYLQQMEKLEERAELDSYDQLSFDDIDDEYAYKKFVKGWEPQYSEEIYQREPVEFEIIEICLKSGDPDVVSMWNSSTVENDKKLYSFDREQFFRKTVTEMCQENNVNVEFGNSYSNIKFTKLDGSFAFTRSKVPFSGIFKGNLESVKKAKQILLQEITTIVKLHVAKRDGIEFFNQADLLIELQELCNLKRLTNKQVLNKILTLITKMEKNLNES
jgi:hypothetical protein